MARRLRNWRWILYVGLPAMLGLGVLVCRMVCRAERPLFHNLWAVPDTGLFPRWLEVPPPARDSTGYVIFADRDLNLLVIAPDAELEQATAGAAVVAVHVSGSKRRVTITRCSDKVIVLDGQGVVHEAAMRQGEAWTIYEEIQFPSLQSQRPDIGQLLKSRGLCPRPPR